MHAQNSTLVLVLYLLIGAVVILAGRLVYLQTSERVTALVPTADEVPNHRDVITTPSGRNRGVSTLALARANQQLTALKSALESSTDLLRQRTERLAEKDAECRRLEAELEESIDFVFSLTDEGGDAGSKETPSDLERQLRALRGELQSTSGAWREQLTQLEDLRAALVESEVRIEEVQSAAEAEFTVLARDREVLLTAVRDSLTLLGEDIVPVLSDLLRHRSPTVRAWSAKVLGSIGPDASAAIPTLLDLVSDSDRTVREEARRAARTTDTSTV